MNKKYEYGGTLYDLFNSLESDGKAGSTFVYYAKESSEPYETYEDLIESKFADLEVEENE